MGLDTAFEIAKAIDALRERQWHLDTIGSYGAADSLQDEICRLRLLGPRYKSNSIIDKYETINVCRSS